MENIVKNVELFVTALLRDNLSANLCFHNLAHTLGVVAAAKEIGQYSHLSEKEMDILAVAAWFHDSGYIHTYTGHEEESKKIAKAYLEQCHCDSSFIASVLACIEATKFPQRPGGILEKVLCDADLYHFTKTSYPQYAKAIRKEFEEFLGRMYSDEEWQHVNAAQLAEHGYCTEYGKSVLSRFKELNVELLYKKKNNNLKS